MQVFIIGIAIALVAGIFAVMPPLPPIDPGIASAGNAVNEFMAHAYFLLCYIFSPVLVVFAITAGLAIMTFEHIYHGVMWVLRKIPMLGIS